MTPASENPGRAKRDNQEPHTDEMSDVTLTELGIDDMHPPSDLRPQPNSLTAVPASRDREWRVLAVCSPFAGRSPPKTFFFTVSVVLLMTYLNFNNTEANLKDQTSLINILIWLIAVLKINSHSNILRKTEHEPEGKLSGKKMVNSLSWFFWHTRIRENV